MAMLGGGRCGGRPQHVVTVIEIEIEIEKFYW